MSLTRRKKGLLLGLGLMSAAALVAFGTSKVASARKKKAAEAAGDDGEAETPQDDEALEERSLWDRAKEVGQGIVLLFTNRKLRD